MKKEIVMRKCELCSQEFGINILSKSKRIINRRFCNEACSKRNNGLLNKGRKHTEEWKKLMSVRNSGENNPFYGKKHTNETKEKISEKNVWSDSDFLIYDFTSEQKEILNGIMISDGSLEKPSRISSRLTLGFKYKETLERIISDLKNMKFNPIYEYKHIDKRNGNLIVNYFTKSLASNTLLFEYNRWYQNGKKVIPKDIEFTPLFCYWWYVLDGYFINDAINLCTESFDEENLSFIVETFSVIGFFVKITSRKRIFFNKKETIKFFDYIKDIKIQKEYEYKFKK
jgi:hypothetical protein